ncbi:hypothetical protein TIFTF001_029509 [Ficus carica]|uniref:Uncharacterized protein n=1 Tax=Ficus carica TaxID=3494 RepID=A0AA88J1M5_FICCA|nr:hypothetical protein TIFTF001_029509 [Ficus carica]
MLSHHAWASPIRRRLASMTCRFAPIWHNLKMISISCSYSANAAAP